MSNNRILDKMRAGQATRGIWLSIPGVHHPRLLARLALDWMIIDMEHAPIGVETMTLMVMAINEAHGPQAVVRLAQASSENIKHALDAGAAGIIAPMVNSAAEAAQVVAWSKLPPIGARSYGSSYAGLTWGQSAAENVRASNSQVMAAVQIESKEALAHLDEIFSSAHLDMALVGPLDLSLSLGADFFSSEPSLVLEEAIERILAAGRRHNLPLGIYCPNAETARRRMAQGFLFVNVAHDTNVLVEATNKALQI